jgi:FkbM family methyltransferase
MKSPRFRGQPRLGTSLVRHLVHSGRPYRSTEGLTLQVDASDYFQACMLLGLYEPVVSAVIERYVRQGTHAVDAGAHMGYFSLKMSRAAGHAGLVHAFECDPRLTETLRAHAEWNGANIAVNAMAVTDRQGELTLRLPDQLGWATVKENHPLHAGAEVTVPGIDLDTYIEAPQKVSFVKIDVEGAELEALRGAAGTLEAAHPTTLVEFFPDRMQVLGQSPQDILGFMADLDYEAWVPRLCQGRLLLDRADEGSAGDLLFVHRS